MWPGRGDKGVKSDPRNHNARVIISVQYHTWLCQMNRWCLIPELEYVNVVTYFSCYEDSSEQNLGNHNVNTFAGIYVMSRLGSMIHLHGCRVNQSWQVIVDLKIRIIFYSKMNHIACVRFSGYRQVQVSKIW